MTQQTKCLLIRWFHAKCLSERKIRLLEQSNRVLVCDGNHITGFFSNDEAGRSSAFKRFNELVAALEESPYYKPGRA